MADEILDTARESSNSKYSDEKKFLKEEEVKNNYIYKSKVKNKFLMNIVILFGITIGFMIVLNLMMLDKFKEYDRKIAVSLSYNYNAYQISMKSTQKDLTIQEICKVALFFCPQYDEARLYNVAQEIYNTGLIKYGLSIDECLVLFSLESEWHRKAVSPAGAKGLGQLMRETCRWGSAAIGIPYDEDIFFNDILNVRVSLYVYNQYKIYFDDHLVWYLTAYNYGETTIRALYSNKKQLSGKYLNYYNQWKDKRDVIEKVLNRKLNIKNE